MKNLSTVIPKYNICEIACRAYSKALSAENIMHAIRRTGIFPLEKTSINSDYLVPVQVFTCLENIPGKGKKNEEEVDDDETNHQEDDILVPRPIDHVSQLEVSENDISGPAGDSSEETFIQEIRTPLPDMTTCTCFIHKIYVPSSSLLQGKYLPFFPLPHFASIFFTYL